MRLQTGDILWKLGYQGDFTLMGGTDPTDWFYAQHRPSFTTTNTTGTFGLALFDNVDDRVFPPGVTCGTTGQSACLYSTAAVLQIDEATKTATLTFHPTAPFFSIFGGNSAVLKNGNVEFCESAESGALAGDIYRDDTGGQPANGMVHEDYRARAIPRSENSEHVSRGTVVRLRFSSRWP